MRVALPLVLASCVVELEPQEAAPLTGEVALYRVESGDSISWIADFLGVRGGYPALMAANGKRSTELRAGEGLRVPLSALVDGAAVKTELELMGAVADRRLEPFEPALAADPLVPCNTLSARGACVELGTTVACIEEIAGTEEHTDELENVRWCGEQIDGARDCEKWPDRELAVYRDGVRTAVAGLPSAGDFELDAHRVDLDADGADELVLAVPLEMYRHYSSNMVRVAIVGGRGGVTQLDIAEWGAGALLEAEGGRCDVLSTVWDWGQLQPLEPMGTYLVARRLAYDAGELVPRGERIVRRMRDLFQWSEQHPEQPATLLRVPEASRWRDRMVVRDPRQGRITELHALEGGLAVSVAFPDGSTVRFDPEARDEQAANLAALYWTTGALVPEAYQPADPTRWVGTEVLVEPDPDCEQACLHTLWVTPR